MFSLIITLVSIALVAALALATLYFGGDAFNKGDASARAAQIVIQGQQLLSAADLFFADKGRWPASVDELVSTDYLKQVPSVSSASAQDSLALTSLAYAQNTKLWTMPQAGRPTFVLDGIATDTCKQVNLKTRGDNGVLRKAYTALTSQCYGTTTDALTVVVTKDRDSLSSALGAEKVSGSSLPTQAQAAEWLALPLESSSQALQGGSQQPENPVTPPAPPPVPNPVFGINFNDVTGASEHEVCQAFSSKMAADCTNMSLINGGKQCMATCTSGFTKTWDIQVQCPSGYILVGGWLNWSCYQIEAGNPASCPTRPDPVIGLANYSVSGNNEYEVCSAFSSLMAEGCTTMSVVGGGIGCKATCTSGYTKEWAFEVSCPQGYTKQGSPLNWYCEYADPGTASMCAGA